MPKAKVDCIIRNAIIVTVNARNEIIENGGIAIDGGKIRDIGESARIAGKYAAKRVIDASGMVAMPGLVNGHVHTITSLYKGTMQGFGFERTAGEDTNLAFRSTPENMLSASRLAAAEMLLSGATLANVATDAITFDVSSQTAEAFGKAGMKAVVQTAIADIFGPTGADANAQIAEAEKLIREYNGKFGGRVRVSLGPAGDISTSIRTMRRLAGIAEREGVVVHTHVFPGWPTGILSWLMHGRSPMGVLRAGGLLNGRLIAVHFLAAKNRYIKALAKAGASVVYCPSVWMNAGIGPKHWPPVKALHDAGVNISLGTDSFGGWIEGSDMFTEMRNCILMGGLLYGAGSLRPVDVIRMATINGARALGLGGETGSLEAGKCADVILLKFDRPPVQPNLDVSAMLVCAASGRDVQTVIIDGKIVMQDRKLLTIDERKAVEDAALARADLYRRAGWKPGTKGIVPPESSWLERYPNEQLAKWGRRWARLKRALGR